MRLNWVYQGSTNVPPKEIWCLRSKAFGPVNCVALSLFSATLMKSWSCTWLVNLDSAYENWKLTDFAPRKGFCTFCTSLICKPSYTERPTGLSTSKVPTVPLLPLPGLIPKRPEVAGCAAGDGDVGVQPRLR